MTFIIVEDSEVVNSGYSVLLDYLYNHYLRVKATFIHVRSPGYELAKNKRPYISSSPTYLHKNEGIIPATIEDNEFGIKLRNADAVKSFHGFATVLAALPGRIPLHLVNTLKFLDCNIGMSISSLLIRHNPKVSSSGSVPKEILVPVAERLARTLISFEDIYQSLGIDSLFLSESVYLSSSIIELAMHWSVKARFFYAIDSPLVISGFPLADSIFCDMSPRAYARLLKGNKQLCNVEDSELIDNLRARLDPDSHNYFKVNQAKLASIDKLLSNDLDIPCVTNSGPLKLAESPWLEKDIIVVLYLHGVTDGSYFLGYSGFPLLSDYFTRLCRAVQDVTRHLGVKAVFLIKPHPNLIIDNPSGYQSIVHKNEIELASFANQLRCIIDNLQHRMEENNMYLLSSGFPLRELICLPNALHLTHHGTVAHDLYSLGLPCVVSSVVPRVDLFERSAISLVYRPETEDSKLEEFIVDNFMHKCPTIYFSKDRNRETHNFIQYNNESFRCIMKRLDSYCQINYGTGFDRYVYTNNLSWSFLKIDRYLQDCIIELGNTCSKYAL
jgi:hypothetical protein